MHVSISGGLDLAVDRARDIGCAGTFQIFTASPRRWAAAPLNPTGVVLFKQKVKTYGFNPFAHMPYMPNLASPEDGFYKQSVDVLVRELERCNELGIGYLVLHFGSHMGSSVERGHERVVAACTKAIKETPSNGTRLLLETSAGTRNSVGSKFEFVRKVLDAIDNEERTGACLDTCHVFASGYDLRNPQAVNATIDQFDLTVGLDRLFLIHINDSKGEIGAASDRHEHIGMGKIGDSGFRALFSSPKIEHVPLILETPEDSARTYREDIAHTKKLMISNS